MMWVSKRVNCTTEADADRYTDRIEDCVDFAKSAFGSKDDIL